MDLLNMDEANFDGARAKLLDSGEPATIGLLMHQLNLFLVFAKKTESRISELERAPLVYEGPHEAGKVYDKGQFTTHNGSLWHCNYKTASRPGDGPAWTLAVKRGADGRDAK